METRIDTMPQLRQICWNRRPDGLVSDADALALYERNWALIDQDAMQPAERAFLKRLIDTVGCGVFMAT